MQSNNGQIRVKRQLLTVKCPGIDPERYGAEVRLYEPRAYWEVFSVDSSKRDVVHSRCQNSKQHFTNKDKVPVTLTHMLFDAVGYSLEERSEVNSPRTVECYHNTHSVLSQMMISISLPWRRRLTTGFIPVTSFPVLPGTSHHQMRYGKEHASPNSSGAPAQSTHASAMVNDFRWRFDFPVVTPGGRQPTLKLSSVPVPGFADATLETGVTATSYFHQYYWEDVWQDHQRHFCCSVPFGTNRLPRDAYGAGSYQGAVGWPTSNRPFQWGMPLDEWDKQAPSDALKDKDCLVREIGVVLDQSSYEDELWASYQAKLADPNVRVANVGSSISTRMRGASACSPQWWRDGAPLSLVMPTRTCARVHELVHPITLAPGEQIDFEVQMPLPWQNDNINPEEPTVSPVYNLGVSFCGYASFLESEIK